MQQASSDKGEMMRINRNMLLNLAHAAVEKSISQDRTILAIYLQGSLLGESPLIGNTADIDLFFIHTDEPPVPREIIRISDEVHLDIAHHPLSVYRQPRELRIHPWLGPAIYGCKILYDPQHFIDFTQASVRGQFNKPENILIRVQRQASHAREIWESFNAHHCSPEPADAALYLRALEHVASALAGIEGRILTERRFLMTLSQVVESLRKPGLLAGFIGLLGASVVDAEAMSTWLPAWREAYIQQSEMNPPIRLHAYRLLYYERAIKSLLNGTTKQDALWPLWHTWTHMIETLPEDTRHKSIWQAAGERLGILGEAFTQKIDALDAYLDTVEETLDNWARENGVEMQS